MTVATGYRRVALAGNPNTGKTTLFNRLTGQRAKVGNYPGVTVDRHFGPLKLPGGTIELIDVPGTYSLSARSEEERLALQALAGLAPLDRPDAILLVVDATQLLRNLYLALQVLELGVPMVVALNMTDQLAANGLELNAERLAQELGVPCVPIAANKGTGLDTLCQELDKVLQDPDRGRNTIEWSDASPALEADIKAVSQVLPPEWHHEEPERRRALARWALLSIDDEDELEGLPPELRRTVEERRRVATEDGREIEEEIIRGRYTWIDERAGAFLQEQPTDRPSLTDRIDRILLNPVLGFALFLGFMVLIFQSLFAWADPAIGWIEGLVAMTGDTVGGLLPAGFFHDLVVSGLIEGVGAVLVFLPQILLLFFFIGLMEDTGYMARVAYLMDRVMKAIGLHGRAFVPMLSGYACAVPAILATRTMERRRDRLLTMMVVPLMTCSARLPVYGLLIAALMPVDDERPFLQGLLMVAMYLFSTVIALVAAAVLGRTVLKGPRVPLLLEMPPYRMPHWPSVARMMWQKSSVFLREAGTVILACTVVMWLLLSYPKNTELARDFDAERQTIELAQAADAEARAEQLAALDFEEEGARLRASYGGRLGRLIEPTIEPLGFDWQIGIGLIGAFAAREVFVSTMAVVYGLSDEEDETSGALRERIRSQKRADGTPVYTPLVCLSLMVFFALACQCMSTLAAVKRETAGYKWPVFLFVYMTALAWVASFAIYQGGHLLGFS